MSSKEVDLPWKEIDSFVGNSTHPALLTYRPCPICGNLQNRTLLIFDDFQFFSDSQVQPKRVKIRDVQCNQCQAVYLNPCYSSTGFRHLFSEASQSYGSTQIRPKEQVDWLSVNGLLKDDNKFLDIGCSDGRFLSYLPKNLRRVGVDIDAAAIARGSELYGPMGVELFHDNFENFHCPDNPDVIILFHVLEHLKDPYKVLCHLREISRKNSHLVIEVPVMELGMTNDINGFLSVQHMTHFSIHSLGQILSRAGWQILKRQQMTDYNGCRIIAKPGTMEHHVTGNKNDFKLIFSYLSHWYAQLAKIEQKIKTWPRTSKIIIWGGGLHTEFLYQVTSFFYQNPGCKYIIVDSDPVKIGKSWRGLPILPTSNLSNVNWNDCQLVVSSYGSQEIIIKTAYSLGVPDTAIRQLYDNVKVY